MSTNSGSNYGFKTLSRQSSSNHSVAYSNQSSKPQSQKQNKTLSTIQRQSPMHRQYLEYFKDIYQQDITIIQQILTNTDWIKQNNIVFINQNKLMCYKKPFVAINSTEYGNMVVNYDIIISNLKMEIKVLNIKDNAPKNLTTLGAGSFGEILRLKFFTKNLVIKRIYFDSALEIFDKKTDGLNFKIYACKKNIEQVLVQYSIYKICSFFRIAPKIQSLYGIDLICYFDSIEFFMEECKFNIGQFDKTQFQYRMKICLKFLHRLKIIHRDIKPANILFSQHYGDYVLADFGLSHPIIQQIGTKTFTYKQGTQAYMSEQMYKLKNNGGMIDLYYNDVWGLKKTVEFYKHFLMQKQQESESQKKLELNTNQQNMYEFYVWYLQIVSIILVKQNKIQIDAIISKYQVNNLLYLIVRRLKVLNRNIIDAIIDRTKSEQTRNFFRINLFKQNKNDNTTEIQFLLRIHSFDLILLIELNQIKSESVFVKDLIGKIQKKINLQFKTDDEFNKTYKLETIQKYELMSYCKKVEKIRQCRYRNYIKNVNILQISVDQAQRINQILDDLMSIKLRLLKFAEIVDIIENNRSVMSDSNLKKYKFIFLFNDEKYDQVLPLIMHEQPLQDKLKMYQTTMKLLNENKKYEHIIVCSIYILLQLLNSNQKNEFNSNYVLAMSAEQRIELLENILKQGMQNSAFPQIKNLYYNHIFHACFQLYNFQLVYKIFNHLFSIANQKQKIYFKGYNVKYLLKKYRYQQALSQCLQYQKQIVPLYGNNYVSSGLIFELLSICYIKLNKFQEAIKCLQNSQMIISSTIGEYSKQYSWVLKVMGIAYLKLNKLEKAFQLLSKALYICVEILIFKCDLRASILTNLALYYEQKQDYKKALGLLYEAVQIRKRNSKQQNYQIIELYASIGRTLRTIHQLQQAYTYFNKVYQYYGSLQKNQYQIEKELSLFQFFQICIMLNKQYQSYSIYLKLLKIKQFKSTVIASKIYYLIAYYQNSIEKIKKSNARLKKIWRVQKDWTPQYQLYTINLIAQVNFKLKNYVKCLNFLILYDGKSYSNINMNVIKLIVNLSPLIKSKQTVRKYIQKLRLQNKGQNMKICCEVLYNRKMFLDIVGWFMIDNINIKTSKTMRKIKQQKPQYEIFNQVYTKKQIRYKEMSLSQNLKKLKLVKAIIYQLKKSKNISLTFLNYLSKIQLYLLSQSK